MNYMLLSLVSLGWHESSRPETMSAHVTQLGKVDIDLSIFQVPDAYTDIETHPNTKCTCRIKTWDVLGSRNYTKRCD